MGEVVRRIPFESLIFILFFIPSALALDSSALLVNYSFDDNQLETGPDTFSIIQHARGTVRLNSIYRLSGYRSLEIRDVAGDGDFPELQGYFPLREKGKLFTHFAIMTPDPREDFNLALAGTRGFTKDQGGIVFWLKTRDGILCHMSDSIPKKMFPLVPFIWYVVDLAYDIDGGRYDLTIRQEGIPYPVIDLRNQISAFHQHASAVDKFSFIGDTGEDNSNVVYYLDDIVIGVDQAINQLPFIAPGRRRLFIDYWHDYQKQIRKTPACLPVRDLSDLGLREDSENDEAALIAKQLWDKGCELLATEDPASALRNFQRAAEIHPGARMYGLSIAMALAALHQWEAVQQQMDRISGDWPGDVRYGLAAAMVGIAKGDLDQAERSLEAVATIDPKTAEEYYFVLLWKQEYTRALQLAIRLSGLGAAWLEKAGDAQLFLNDPVSALQWYQRAIETDPKSVGVLLKLSDVHFLIGDFQKERYYRENIYGALQE